MRRILIDDETEEIVEEYVKELTGDTHKHLHWQRQAMPQQKLMDFYNFLSGKKEFNFASYVSLLYELYEDILRLKPNEFDDFHQKYFNKWDFEDLGKVIIYNGNKLPFYAHIVDCMRYESLRSEYLRVCVKKLNIKACVYCNAQYTITTDEFEDEKGKKHILGTYEFDHFKPKSKYPYLCTSFYNLQPSCPTCNKNKSDKDSLFNLYTTDTSSLDVFTFELTPNKGIFQYISDDMENLHVKLTSHCPRLLDNHRQLFHIDEIYAQHLDVVHYVIARMRQYNESGKSMLENSLKPLFPKGVDDPEYFFFGYYMEKDMVHYKPLSKLVQDIVQQIK